jgi:thiol-disulfide isomerase/thioredoxin
MSLKLVCAVLIGWLGQAADLTLRDLNGQSHSLEEYRGKIVVLNFWATWCVPCRAEMPLLVLMSDRYAASDVVIVGASADEESTQSEVGPFVDKRRISFPIWIGATTKQMKDLGLSGELPATVFIDREGNVVDRVIGLLRKRDLEKRIERLVGSGKKG